MSDFRSSSVADFSKRHGWSEVTTYRLIKSGTLRACKVGRRTIITSDDERAFLAALPTLNQATSAAA